jgi:hypothetical protein
MIGFNGGLIGKTRDTSGTASVPGVWTPGEQVKAKRSLLWPANAGEDFYFANVSLLLRGNGSNGSTTFTDASLNNFSITANGTVQISTTQSKYGGASMYFSGSTSNFLSLPSNSAFTLTGDFTIEFWAWKSAAGYYDCVIGTSSGSANFIELTSTRNNFLIYFSSGSVAKTSYNPNDSTWHHYAVSRSGSSVKMYIDGVEVASGTNSTSFDVSGGYIGKCNAFPFNGYIDDLRVTKGVARYTANFTPPGAL